MNTRFGRGRWRPLPLFRIVQSSGKVRLISDARRGGHNEMTSEEEAIFVPTADFVPEAARMYANAVAEGPWSEGEGVLPEWAHMTISTEDLDEAYGQCPVERSHLRFAVVCWYSVEHKAWRFAESVGLVFGFRSAVPSFNRWPLLMSALGRRIFALIVTNYFDDFCDLEGRRAAVSGKLCLAKAAAFVGGAFGISKSMPPGAQRPFVGILNRLDLVDSLGVVTCEPRDQLRQDIEEEANERLRTRVCTAAQASKLRGRAGFASTNLFARCGRLCMGPLKQRQYFDKGRAVKEGSQLESALKHLARVVPVAVPRSISVWTGSEPPVLVYSDASWPSYMDGEDSVKIPRVGWVVMIPGRQPLGFTCVVNHSILSRLAPRRQQIMALEAFAAVAAPWTSPELFQGRDILWFIDNESAISSLVRGSSRPEDVDNIAAMATVQALQLSFRPWYEWIDSKSNPSDGLSRAGAADEWTVAQGWQVTDLGDIPWDDLFHALAPLEFY